MRKFFLIVIAILAGFSLSAQISTAPVKSHHNASPSCAEGDVISWTVNNFIFGKSNEPVSLLAESRFTSFGIGWTCSDQSLKPSEFSISYRVKNKAGQWSGFFSAEGYVHPSETPTQKYWTDLIFAPSQEEFIAVEFQLSGPSGQTFASIELHTQFIPAGNTYIHHEQGNSKACPYRPGVIPRSVWLDPYYTQPAYTPTPITPTHCVVHHGASPDTYTDGASVVRSYWNYHVNSLGWSDVGYNYLFDKYGNIYQGRMNSTPLSQDVRGAHAGASNDYSIGINFLGNADVTLPTATQLDTLEQFLAWWFDWRGFDPTTSASMILQYNSSPGTVPRILGHKDTNVGGTSCPGTTLYGYLPSIRTNTKTIIDACSGSLNPTNLTAVNNGCPNNYVTFSWTNSGSGWYIYIATDAGYTNPYIKWVSGLTTYTAPSGFVLVSDGTTPLTFTDGTTYYWKIWNGTTWTSGPSFTTLNCDNVAPTTDISTPAGWKTDDFQAAFNDTDGVAGSGIEKRFYQILDYNGTYWTGNPARGFFGDNFDVMQPDWASALGTWNIVSGEMVQSDESQTNSNLYMNLNQTLSNRYLYHFLAKVEGAGSNRRFGFHFFCDDGSQTNRGNSYFIWFRVESQTLEFYKVVNNAFTGPQKTISGVTTTAGQYYDIKVSFDRISGKICVWRDNVYMGDWTDSSPHTAGNAISFRSGDSKLSINELKVYRSRYPDVTVTVGTASDDIRFQNPNPSTYGAKVKSIVVDGNNNLSAIAYHDLNVDFTPAPLFTVNDGSGMDADTTWNLTAISANWIAADPNSGIAEYLYAVGTTPGASDIVGWSSCGTTAGFTETGLSLTTGQIYYISVIAENNAGLLTDTCTSDGITAVSTALPNADFTALFTELSYPDTTAYFTNLSVNATQYLWDFGDGSTSTDANPWHAYSTTGYFTVTLIAMNPGFPNDTLVLTDYIHVFNLSGINVVQQAILVSPNPFHSVIHITLPEATSGSVTLTDANGKIVLQQKFSQNSDLRISVPENLEQGHYLLIVNDGTRKYTKKVVKTNG